MLKYVIFAAIALSASAFAQDNQSNVGNSTTPEKPKLSLPDEQFCVYEDKKYTEGAVKKLDGIALVCMKSDGFTTGSYANAAKAPRPLVWESVNSRRGKDRLSIKSSSDVFK